MLQVNIQIDGETAEKLLYIQQQTERDRAEILKIAVAEYYKKLEATEFVGRIGENAGQKQANPNLDAWSDFIGSIEAAPDLVGNHKAYLREKLDKKYDNR